MDHHTGHHSGHHTGQHAGSGSQHDNDFSQNHGSGEPSTTTQSHHHHRHHNPHHHNRAEQTVPPTSTSTAAATQSLSSHDHHNHRHHGSHSNVDPTSGPDLGDHHRGNHLHPSAGHGDMKHHGMANMDHAGMGPMKPVFKWVTDAQVLFEHWTTSTILELTLAMLAAAALAAGYELLRNWLSTWDNTHRGLSTLPWWKRTCLRCFRSVLHALGAAVGYVQMLFAMTYDLRIFVAIILGSGLGFFVLGPYFRNLINEQKRCKPNALNGCAADAEGLERKRILVTETDSHKEDSAWLERQDSEMPMLPEADIVTVL